VIAEVELAFRNMKGKLAAITGTDGKSTTTSLTGHIFDYVKKKTFTGGNLGTPFISFAGDTDDDSVSVIELSSFQLETIAELKPDAAVILNVTPDHLDRYAGMEDYLQAKLRIAMNQGPEDFYIYRKEDAMLDRNLNGIRARKLSFSVTDSSADAFFNKDSIFLKNGDANIEVLNASKMKILGLHNMENTMASLLIVCSILKKMGHKPDYKELADACYSFNGLPHRMEMIGSVKGRRFINDSKATTVGAVEMALASLPFGSILIMGGRTKGDDYSRLAKTIKEKVKHLVLIGESAEDFKKIYDSVPGVVAESMDDAVRKAIDASSVDDVIILSPACASFDMFANFEERGDKFREAVMRIGH
jgi:UDP-N-acetylmuramoylalanine--D-glutamate ligase